MGVVAIQWSGVFSSDGQPSAPASPAVPARGPNVGLAPDWAGQQAASRSISGPNAGLAPTWIGSQAAVVAANPGPNAGLPTLDVTTSGATAAAVNSGPNVGLAPDWISQHAAYVAANRGPNAGLPGAPRRRAQRHQQRRTQHGARPRMGPQLTTTAIGLRRDRPEQRLGTDLRPVASAPASRKNHSNRDSNRGLRQSASWWTVTVAMWTSRSSAVERLRRGHIGRPRRTEAAAGVGHPVGGARIERLDRRPDRRRVGRLATGDRPQDVQGYVHHLRSRVPGGLETDKAGYSLDVCDERVDERRFTAAVEAARRLVTTDPLEASDLLADALGLWRGTPYADLDGAPVLLPEITRLTESRLVALGDRIDADLALGRHELLAGELESLTVDHPFHERFRGQLMLALYRSGRHGEALRAYSRTRSQFVDEMGIDPSDRLQHLEHRILDRDPTLDLAEPPSERGDRPRRAACDPRLRAPRPDRDRRRRHPLPRLPAVGGPGGRDPGHRDRARQRPRLHRPLRVRRRPCRRPRPPAHRLRPGHVARARLRLPGHAMGRRRALDAHLAANRPNDWAATKIVEQLGGALAAAHRAGVVHGDVRAGTALITEDGDALLTDFVVGRPPGDEVDDRRAFARLAYHVVFGLAPGPGADVRPLLDATVTSPELRAVFTTALGEGEPPCIDELVQGIRRALGGAVVQLATDVDESAPPRSDARNPYKGLQAFQTADAGDFFGRDAIVDRLADLVHRHRLVTVVGPSGSGKSSIVKAGLLPRLASGGRPYLVAEMYPGAYPFDALARALRTVAVADGAGAERLVADSGGLSRALADVLPAGDADLVLVIDQFEELFAAVASESTRALFLDSVTRAVTAPDSRLRVVLTLRGDFFDRPLRYAEFGALVEAGLLPVAMPSDTELAAAIERPAVTVGVAVEPGVAAEMIRDVADEPGGLPLLQYALTDLFERRTGDVLTADAYRQSGGVLGSLAARADQLFTDLDAAGQRAMQQAFLRMVSVDESAEVRRRVTRADLAALEVDQAALDEGLQRFGAHRLLTFDSEPVSRAPTVEVAHEALLREWDRLRRWIEDQREQLVVRRRLDEAVREWEDAGEHAGYLLRGRRLAQFDQWAADTDIALSASERAFLQTSREHDEAQARTATSRRRRVMVALGVAATAALVFAIVAFVQREDAADEAFAAETARLGNEAGFVVERDRQLALLMAVETARRDPGVEGLSALQRVLVESGPYLGTSVPARSTPRSRG